MADTTMASAIREKRARLAGELIVADKRAATFRDNLAAIDAALRVYDPSSVPHFIRPVIKRNRPVQFRHGRFSRVIMEIIRQTPKPMTCRDIATRIAREHQIDVTAKPAMNKLLGNVRNVLAKGRDGLVSAKHRDTIYWSGGK